MKARKFLELSKAKGLAVLTATNIFVLYITRNLFLVPEVLMVCLGATALLRAKLLGVLFKEKKPEIKKGIYFSLIGIVLGFGLKKILLLNFVIEIVLLLLILMILKEIYFGKTEKWINAFVLMGSFLIASGIILFLFNLIENQIFLF